MAPFPDRANCSAFAVEACEYNFPHENVGGFLALSQVLEGVGTSAYLGAAGSIENKDFLLAAYVLIAPFVEARLTVLTPAAPS